MGEDKKRSSVLIIYTGGTIGMKKDSVTNALAPFNLDEVLIEVPELSKFNIEISTYTFDPIIDSSETDPHNWAMLATLIQDNYSKYDGFVVLHGTDTMAYSASALSFMLKNLNKPVIFTGSQIPIGEIRTDGKENIITAVEIAGSKECGKSIVPEVAIYFHNHLYRGNRTTKFSSEHLDAFKSVNYPPLAEVGIDIKYNYNYIKKSEEYSSPLKISTNMCSEVAIVELYPGMSTNVLRSMLNIEGIKGVIIKSYGAGNAPSNSEFVGEIKKAIKKGLIILNITQCKSGSVNMSLYSTGITLKNIGVISGYDMTTEAALTKLMYLVDKNYKHEDIAMYLTNSMRGELKKE